MVTTNSADFYRRPHLTTLLYTLGLLLFLLPFFNINCNSVTVANINGLSMATGGKPSVSGDLERMQRGLGAPVDDNAAASYSDTRGENHLFITALIALVMGVFGLILSLVNKGRNQPSHLIAGILGVLGLIGAWVETSAYVSSHAKSTGQVNPGDQFANLVKVTASPTSWFFLCLLCYTAAAYLSYRLGQTAADTPPPNAPQLKLENPGEQSEFPSAPTDNEQLG